MTSRSAAALFLLTTLIWAKGDTVVIEVQGGALTTPLKITDPRIQDFNIWSGPGVNGATLENATGFIIDWPAGVVAPAPAGLQHYEISFYEGCRVPNDWCRAEKPSLAYVVFYDYDPSSKRGFVYLPGKGEPWYVMNVRSIWHGDGVEGHWFLAADSWEGFVRPLIAKCRKDANRGISSPH
jgi:hypothetical protein